jgi:hypothetical protein
LDIKSPSNFRAFGLDRRVAATAVGVDEDRCSAVERARFVRPTVRVNHGSNSGNSVEALLQEQRAGAKFVIAGAVARPARDENDFFIRRECSRGDGNHAEPNEKSRTR